MVLIWISRWEEIIKSLLGSLREYNLLANDKMKSGIRELNSPLRASPAAHELEITLSAQKCACASCMCDDGLKNSDLVFHIVQQRVVNKAFSM